MAFGLSMLFGASASVDPAVEALTQEQAALSAAKAEAIDRARATAKEQGRQPTMTDYLQSAMAMPELGQNAAVIANLSGQTLDGFLIRKEDLELTAQHAAKDLGQFFPGQQESQQEATEQREGIRAVNNVYDTNADGKINVEAISKFCDETKGHWKFDGACFHGCTFQPATTLEVLNHAVGATYADITLCGLEPGEVLTIGTMETGNGKAREVFSNVKLRNAENETGGHYGTIRIAANCTLNGFSAEGGRAEIVIAPGGQINQCTADNETLSLKAHPGSKMFLPCFNEVNFTPDSGMSGVNMQGDIMSDRTYGFTKSNLNGMNFDRCNISGIAFESTDLTGATFRNAQRIADCVFKDVTGLETVAFDHAHVHNVTIEHKGQSHHCTNLADLQQFQNNFTAINAAIAIGQGMDVSTRNLAPAERATEFHATNAVVSNPDALAKPTTAMNEAPAATTGGDRISTERTTIAYGGDTGNIDSTLATARNDNRAVPITEEALAARVADIMKSHMKM